jgi:hypothetical protein
MPWRPAAAPLARQLWRARHVPCCKTRRQTMAIARPNTSAPAVPCAAPPHPGVASCVRAASCFQFLKVGSGATRTPGHWPARRPFRSIGDRLALQNDDCASYPGTPASRHQRQVSVWQAVIQRCLSERRGCAENGRSPDRNRTAQVDPFRSFGLWREIGTSCNAPAFQNGAYAGFD